MLFLLVGILAGVALGLTALVTDPTGTQCSTSLASLASCEPGSSLGARGSVEAVEE